MKKSLLRLIFTILICSVFFVACGDKESSVSNKETETKKESASSESTSSEKEEKPSYEQISQEKAKEIMDTETDYIILDVREQEEYDEAHIAGAILIPNHAIKEKAESVLTDKSQLILVYCRSGRRSKLASEDLADLGYTNVKEFGGIIDWQYGTVTE